MQFFHNGNKVLDKETFYKKFISKIYGGDLSSLMISLNSIFSFRTMTSYLFCTVRQEFVDKWIVSRVGERLLTLFGNIRRSLWNKTNLTLKENLKSNFSQKSLLSENSTYEETFLIKFPNFKLSSKNLTFKFLNTDFIMNLSIKQHIR